MAIASARYLPSNHPTVLGIQLFLSLRLIEWHNSETLLSISVLVANDVERVLQGARDGRDCTQRFFLPLRLHVQVLQKLRLLEKLLLICLRLIRTLRFCWMARVTFIAKNN
jgi:hypothetical protein